MKQILLTVLKYLTLPFAIIYGVIVFIRNKFYDWNIFSSIEFSTPVICVGNITVGGTGKSPHIEYLIELLQPMYALATLSRGYKRYSRGFKLADANTNARDIGDEPFQFKSKYPNIEVCVAEERMTAIPELLQKRHHVQVILLDDAFQHRTVKAGMNILLTDFERLYTRDYIMPFGLLRESRAAAQRANLIFVTKCPSDLSVLAKQKMIEEINPGDHQSIYFTSIEYKNLYPLTPNIASVNQGTEVLLVTGIANPKSLVEKLKSTCKKVYTLEFKDHHYFTYDDIEEIQSAFQHITSKNKIIITTEKDAARFMLLKEKIIEYALPFYAQSIGIEVLFGEGENLNQEIISFIQNIIPPLPIIEIDPNHEEVLEQEIE